MKFDYRSGRKFIKHRKNKRNNQTIKSGNDKHNRAINKDDFTARENEKLTHLQESH